MNRSLILVFCLLLFFLIPYPGLGKTIEVVHPDTVEMRYKHNNTYVANAFPRAVISSDFRIPISADRVLVVYPTEATSRISAWQKLINERLGVNLVFVDANTVSESQLSTRHIVLLGDINNNSVLLTLYEQRRTFVDAYFPGKGGYVIHPATSIWNQNLNVLVVGASSLESLDKGFMAFMENIPVKSGYMGSIRLLHTNLPVPKPPQTVEKTLQSALAQARLKGAPYGSIADWGMYYSITGDKKWAEHFKAAMYMLYERARINGQWIPEPWTNIYFNLWKFMLVWDNIDDDPFFTEQDRKVIDEVLWGYMVFVDWLPNLDADQTIRGEMKQNHTTFLGLSLYFSYRYYTEKYGMKDLGAMMEKVHRCFEDGQSNTFIPNDDAGAYLKYAPLHTLAYMFAKGNKEYVTNGHLINAADLTGVTFDNFGNQVSFGDVGTYTHTPRHPADANFFSMVANFHKKPEYQWMYNWLGGSSKFLIDRLYTGVYARDMESAYAEGFTGIKAVELDSVTLTWFARRSETLMDGGPLRGDRYFHKMSFRKSFDPNDEYLLLDGVSGLSHGHNDGNSILRLNWKERIWLFDMDYFKLNTKFHNGVTVVRDGKQFDPPMLNRLDFVVDHKGFGVSKSTSQSYNGADWERSIVWNKGNWFLVFDRIKANEAGDYRLDGRWRTRGDVVLKDNTLKVTQGDKALFIKSADKAFRTLQFESDNARSNWSSYPWGKGGIEVLSALNESYMDAGEEYVFANLLVASDDLADPGYELLKIDDNLYKVSHKDNNVFIGLNSSSLIHAGISTDAELFWLDAHELHLINGSYLRVGNKSLYDVDESTHMIIDLTRGNILDTENNMLVTLSSAEFASFKETLHREIHQSQAQQISPSDKYPKPMDFAVRAVGRHDLVGYVSGFSNSSGDFVLGDTSGNLLYFRNGDLVKEWATPAKMQITTIALGDLDGSGFPEVVAGDAAGHLYCYGVDGSLKWQHILTSYYGANFSVKDIAIGQIDTSGEPTVVVGTGGWKVYAIRPNGDIRWECLTFYHEITKVGILDRGDSRYYVVAGTEYQTPVNVIDAMNGKIVYFTWEEMGSEFISTTEYFGIHLTDMVFLDADGDGEQDIVFGTLSNQIYAINAGDGKQIWEANVGDEVARMETFIDRQTGKQRLLIANGYGSLLLYDVAGKLLSRIELDGQIQDLLVMVDAEGNVDIVVATESGIRVVDHQLTLQGSFSKDNQSYKKLYLLKDNKKRNYRFAAIGSNSMEYFEYEPLRLRKSRQY